MTLHYHHGRPCWIDDSWAVKPRKKYYQLGPFEIQIGRVSKSIALFWRRPWRRLVSFR
jgi:hypothetical protein